MANQKFPEVPKALIEFLEERFPLKAALNCETVEDLHKFKGEQAVIGLLRYHFDRQNETILEKT